jgi:hypothetical protein
MVAVLSDIAKAAFTPRGTLSTRFCKGMSQRQGHSGAERIVNEKIQVAPFVPEPTTFRLVAHYFNNPVTW